jgi:hypothetical protein
MFVAGELCFKITVSHIQPQKETTGMWREKFKEMAANFYDAILTNPELHMNSTFILIFLAPIVFKELSVTNTLSQMASRRRVLYI